MGKLVSVIMGIYNCESTLPAAITCIIAQTYCNWELILCDDASSDHTLLVAQEFARKYPDKIRVLRNEKNSGLNHTLNRCLKMASGDYIARMDGDDLCDPERFLEEIKVLEQNKELAIVSCDMAFFDEFGTWGKTKRRIYPEAKHFLGASQFCHAACMVRKDVMLDVGGYSEGKWFQRVEDYHLWIKIYARGFRGMNIQKVLYQMRDDRNAQKRRTLQNRLNECYVKHLAIKMLHLPLWSYAYCLKPLVLAFTPGYIYSILHRIRNS